jgi:23S rRNA (cytidine1920-2'-O)/16S rRNA (cytidine1409-2'-O)-methyltransferase
LRFDVKKDRLDKVLVERGLAETQRKAQAMIMAGLVSSESRNLSKPGQLIDRDQSLALARRLPYVGRGGLKLEEALDIFQIEVKDEVCADVGVSTGGFTDCLLQRGAARVYAVDVDVRQIDPKLRRNPRVILIEKNARYVEGADFAELPRIIVMDVSFISVLKIFPALREVLCPGGLLLSLLKPQFEAERGRAGKRGVVRDPALHAGVLRKIAEGAAAMGLSLRGFARCSTRGRKGNREFFGLWVEAPIHPPRETVLKWIEEVTRDEND